MLPGFLEAPCSPPPLINWPLDFYLPMQQTPPILADLPFLLLAQQDPELQALQTFQAAQWCPEFQGLLDSQHHPERSRV